MEKFLYLNEIAHVATWVNGGPVPLNLASSYVSRERRGTNTPDELRELDCPDPDGAWRIISSIFVGATPDNCDVNASIIGPQGFMPLKDRREDGLILCLSNSFDIEKQANRYRKDACVRILDVEALKRVLDDALGAESQMRSCDYTAGRNRNPFLKSVEDKWQDEFRLYWKSVKEPKWVPLSAGLAVEHWRRTTEPRPAPDPRELQAPNKTPVNLSGRNSIDGPTIIARRRPPPKRVGPLTLRGLPRHWWVMVSPRTLLGLPLHGPAKKGGGGGADAVRWRRRRRHNAPPTPPAPQA